MRLYIGNLPYGLDDERLGIIFAIYSPSRPRVIRDDAGNSKGFGFLDMPDEAGEAAIKEMDGFEVEGRQLRVAQAHDKPKGNQHVNFRS